MTEAERVLAELAKRLHNPKPESVLTWDEVKALTAPYLPKPEPDRLMVAARECAEIGKYMCAKDAAHQIRAIIAREVAATEPSDEALRHRAALQRIAEFYTDTDLAAKHMVAIARAALKGEGA